MAEIKEEDLQSTFVDYGRDVVTPSVPVNAPVVSTPDLGTNIQVREQTKVNPEPNKEFAQVMYETNSPYHAGIFKPIKGREPTYTEKNPYYRSYINFKNNRPVGEQYTSFFPSLDPLKTQLKNKADASGAYSPDNMKASTSLGIGTALGNPAAGGVMGMILGMKEGGTDPVTGNPTAEFAGFSWLSNMTLEHKYNGVQQIRSALKTAKLGGNVDVGDAFKLGPHSFVRKPGQYNFYGNLSATGLNVEQMHGMMALERGIDPTTYNWRDGTGTKVLAYGNGGAYRLDGKHVDYNKRTSSNIIGTMESSTWRSMTNTYFNGNGGIAKAWLDEVKPYQNFTGKYDKATLKKLEDILYKYQNMAGAVSISDTNVDTNNANSQINTPTNIFDADWNTVNAFTTSMRSDYSKLYNTGVNPIAVDFANIASQAEEIIAKAEEKLQDNTITTTDDTQTNVDTPNFDYSFLQAPTEKEANIARQEAMDTRKEEEEKANTQTITTRQPTKEDFEPYKGGFFGSGGRSGGF